MPSKIKSKLLIITVMCITLAILFVIAPATASLYSLVLLGISLFSSLLAWNNARLVVSLQYKISKFISLMVVIFIAIFGSVSHIAGLNMKYLVITACVIAAFRAMSLLFSAEE